MNKTILCIDDADPVLQLYGRVFEEQGYKVILASNGWDGLEVLKHREVDCVILDYEMPGMNGAAVVKQLGLLGAAPPVVLISGSDPPWELRARVGAFIAKPMRVAQLLECVEGVIDADEQRHADRRLDWAGSRAFVPGVCDPT
ncbi:MAG: response regulator [Candidatus Sulfotelmatobacter sp.]